MEGYKLFFNFKKEPFQLSIDNDLFYLSSVHDEALKLLEYAIKIRKDFVVLLGEKGTGKTSLVKFLLSNLKDVEQSFVVNPFLNREEFLRYICSDFGILLADDSNENKVIEELNQFLVSVFEKGKKAVVVIDDAHNMNVETLKLILHLSNMEKNNQKLIQFIFVGRPQFADIINSEEELKQLRQRITLIIQLRPLIYEDIKNYVKNRIWKALGERKDVFEEETFRLIYEYSGGIPLEINKICGYALIAAFEERSKTVKKHHIEEAYGKLYPSNSRPICKKEENKRSKFKKVLIVAVFSILVVAGFSVFQGFFSKEEKILKKEPPLVRKTENKIKSGTVEKSLPSDNISMKKDNESLKVSGSETKKNDNDSAKKIAAVVNKLEKNDNMSVNNESLETEKKMCVYFKVNQKLRSEPDLKSGTILVIPKHSYADYLDEKEGWFFVRYDSKDGWVLHKERFNELRDCTE